MPHRIKIIFLSTVLSLFISSALAQTPAKVIYIIDSIPVLEDPEEGDDIQPEDIADMNVIKSKDSLNRLGFGEFDGAVYIFTKPWRARTEDIKRIPSSMRMERKNGAWFLNSLLYSGPFIDYYYKGNKKGEGVFKNGKVDGLRTMYFQNGNKSLERNYTGGTEHGVEKEYYEDGSLKQKGEFVDGKENGVWERYFPNGQVKQRSTFRNGVMEGETTVYYSTGRVLAVEIIKDGRSVPDPRLAKIDEAMNKGHRAFEDGDMKNAIKQYSKAIELDSGYAGAYFARGTLKLNELKFDEALADFDKGLKFEPFSEKALTNRAFVRIRKHEMGSSRPLSNNSGVTILASKTTPLADSERALICNDLKQAIFLGDKGQMIMDAFMEYCAPKTQR